MSSAVASVEMLPPIKTNPTKSELKKINKSLVAPKIRNEMTLDTFKVKYNTKFQSNKVRAID